MEDLDAASLEDVSAFFRTYYAPNNAVLSVVGDVDTAAVRASAERYFGGIPANPSIPPLGDLSLPPTLGGESRETVYDRVPLPRVYVGFRAPVYGDPRLDALDIAGQILAGGKGSRLHRRLVRDERIAQDVALFTLGFVGGRRSAPAGRRSGPASRSARVEAALHEELERLAVEPVIGRRAGPGVRADRGRRAGRPAAGRGASRPAVDVRDAVRRPGAHQPDARPLPVGDAGGHPGGRRATCSGPTTGSS